MNKLPFIDALRGIAFLGVLISHAARDIEIWGFLGDKAHLTPWVYTLSEQGARGVQLFFVISAFTLCLSHERRKHENRPILNFGIRRWFRIAPLFYCALIFYTIRPALQLKRDWPSIGHMLSTLTFTNGWYPYWLNAANAIVPGGWSIAVEMTFYLIFPFLFSRIKSLKQTIVLTAIALVTSQTLFFLLQARLLIPEQDLWDVFIFLWFPNQLPIFFLGFALYFIYCQIRASRLDNLQTTISAGWLTHRQVVNVFLLISVVLLFLLPFQTYHWIPIHFAYGLDFLVMSICLLLSPARLLVNSFLCYLGTLSFSAYLTHFYALEIVNKVIHTLRLQALPPDLYLILLIVLGLPGTIIASHASYHLIELPGIGLGRRLIKWFEAHSATLATPPAAIAKPSRKP